MKYCLVDFENITTLPSKFGSEFDEVVIFESHSSPKASKLIHKISKGQTIFRKKKVVGSGKNNMDFHIATYCGFLLGESSNSEITILSNDKDYTNICQFWRSRGMSVLRKSTNIKAAKTKTKANEQPIFSEVSEKFKDTPPILIKIIVDQFLNCKKPKYSLKKMDLLERYMIDKRYPKFNFLLDRVILSGFCISSDGVISTSAQ